MVILHSAYVLALLVGSVTGAGLVLTVYTLLVTKGEDLLKHRTKTKRKIRSEYLEHLKALQQKMPPEDFNKKKIELARDQGKMVKAWGIPGYLGDGLVGSFVLYAGTAVLSVWWFWTSAASRDNIGTVLSWTFVIATLFLILGGTELMFDIRSYLKEKL